MASQDDYSDIPKEVPASEDYVHEPENVVRGHKATITNPNTSDEAKEHSHQVLENEYGETYDRPNRSQGDRPEQPDKDQGNVARGLKASISNPGVSEDAKEDAKKKLEHLSQA
ncbi:conidiation protein [Verticillium dahliae]